MTALRILVADDLGERGRRVVDGHAGRALGLPARSGGPFGLVRDVRPLRDHRTRPRAVTALRRSVVAAWRYRATWFLTRTTARGHLR